MKIATLYRKDGKVILETDNDAIAQVATDSPQDVVVMDAYERTAVHYLTGARKVGRPAFLTAPYGQNVPPHGMAGIDEVRERLRRLANIMSGGRMISSITASDDLHALLADHAQLQADAGRYRKLRAALLDDKSERWESFIEQPEPTTEHEFDAAIDAAKAVQS